MAFVFVGHVLSNQDLDTVGMSVSLSLAPREHAFPEEDEVDLHCHPWLSFKVIENPWQLK
jgi:hypothetical protein